MTCKLYGVLVAACAVANQVAGLALVPVAKPALPSTPLLPPFAGVTLSGMDYESNFTQPATGALGKDLSLHSFTLPDYEQALHYLEDRNVSLVKLPLSLETLLHNITKLEVYTDVVATVTSRNATALVSLTMSAVHFANFTSHDRVHKDGPLLRQVANASFVDFWGKMAAHFKNDRRVAFQLLVLPSHTAIPRDWNETIQAAVTSIRNAGARNVVVLPSYAVPNDTTTFNTFRDFPKDFERMQHVKNPDGTTDGIVFDVSQTLAFKNSTVQRCGGVDVSDIVDPVFKLLKKHKRQAIVGTLAAPSHPSCTRTLVKFAKEITKSYPSFAGFVLYGAGAYDQSLPWALVKEGQSDSTHCATGEWVDQPNFASVQPYFPKQLHHLPTHTHTPATVEVPTKSLNGAFNSPQELQSSTLAESFPSASQLD